MRKQIGKKLKSRKGASITFSLLLFLVCATLCTVIIVAATTSAGRMAGISEMDRQYYGVSNASELLKDMFKGKKVTLATVTESSTITTYAGDGSTETVDDGDPSVKVYLLANKSTSDVLDAIGTDEDLLTPANQVTGRGAEGVFLPMESFLNDAAYQYYQYASADTDPETRTLTITSNEYTVNLPEVSVQEEVDADGGLKFTVRNTAGRQYVQELVFGADVIESGGPKTEEQTTITPEIAGVTNKQIRTTTTNTELMTITWDLDSIQTLANVE